MDKGNTAEEVQELGMTTVVSSGIKLVLDILLDSSRNCVIMGHQGTDYTTRTVHHDIIRYNEW